MPRRRRPSKSEAAVVAHLRTTGIPFVHDQAGFFEGRPLLRPDVVVPSLRLVIEVDGIQHMPGRSTKWKSYTRGGVNPNDLYKDEACAAAGFHVARIPYTVKVCDVSKVVDRALEHARKYPTGPLLGAYRTDYYHHPRPLPWVGGQVIDLTSD